MLVTFSLHQIGKYLCLFIRRQNGVWQWAVIRPGAPTSLIYAATDPDDILIYAMDWGETATKMDAQIEIVNKWYGGK